MALQLGPGSSDPNSPDDPTVEGKGAEDAEDVEMSLEAKLPEAIAWVDTDADTDGQTPPKGFLCSKPFSGTQNGEGIPSTSPFSRDVVFR